MWTNHQDCHIQLYRLNTVLGSCIKRGTVHDIQNLWVYCDDFSGRISKMCRSNKIHQLQPTPKGRQEYLEEGARLHRSQEGSAWDSPICLLHWVTPGIPGCGFLRGRRSPPRAPAERWLRARPSFCFMVCSLHSYRPHGRLGVSNCSNTGLLWALQHGRGR